VIFGEKIYAQADSCNRVDLRLNQQSIGDLISEVESFDLELAFNHRSNISGFVFAYPRQQMSSGTFVQHVGWLHCRTSL